jgi:hypothetical protein
MKSIAATTLALFFAPAAFAANPASELLAKYSTKNINEKCEVRYENDVLSIVSLFESRASYQRYVTDVEQVTSDVIRLSHNDRDGKAEVFLIRMPHVLKVLATWEDGEYGLDASSFCELEAR